MTVLGPKRAASIEISDYYSATANLNLQKRRVQSVRMRKFSNFVPWHVHRQVLVLSALGTIHIIRNHFMGDRGGFIKSNLCGLILEFFSLWFLIQNNMPNHYPDQIFLW